MQDSAPLGAVFSLFWMPLFRSQSPHADIRQPNAAGLTPSDIAKGLKCTKSWNDALRDCGLDSDILHVFSNVRPFDEDLDKESIFHRWWEDYNHFHDWGCWPDSCSGTCPWWEEYDRQWLPWCQWDVKYPEWEEL
jgi:hypothetical protein